MTPPQLANAILRDNRVRIRAQMSETAPMGGTEIAPGVFAPPGLLRLQFARGGGPGGQNVNKLNTKAELWVHVESLIGLRASAKGRLRVLAGSRLTLADEIHLSADAERSQEANRQSVLQRLREMVVQARVEPKLRRRTKPSKASKQRRLEQKRRRSGIKAHRRAAESEE
jgi:ribosome-associated protein